jgi:prefoldin subunit 5
MNEDCCKISEYQERIKFLEDELDELTEELKNANEHIAEIEETYKACREAAEVFIKTLPESDSEEETTEHTD